MSLILRGIGGKGLKVCRRTRQNIGHVPPLATIGVSPLKKLTRKKRTVPPAPAHLSAEAKNWWRRIHEENEIGDQSGLLILATALESFDRMRAAQAVISEMACFLRSGARGC
jgi:hypothetical protein